MVFLPLEIKINPHLNHEPYCKKRYKTGKPFHFKG